MNIVELELSKLNTAKYNPRTITKEEFDGLKKSLETFGQQENLIINKNKTIISGHQRYEAMLALGWTKAFCNVVDLDEYNEKKLNVIMNSSAISGKYDDLKLAELLEILKLDEDYEDLRLNLLEPLDLSDIDYDILNEDLDSEMSEMINNVKKAIQIEFKMQDFQKAKEIVKEARDKNIYIGNILIQALKKEL